MGLALDLQKDVPSVGMHDIEKVNEWCKGVKEWIAETARCLKVYSAGAELAFLHDPEGQSVGREDAFRGINSHAKGPYLVLVTRLQNLRGIMENPSVYL